MTARELSTVLGKLSKLLSLYDDLPIDEALDQIYQAAKTHGGPSSKRSHRHTGQRSMILEADVISTLSSMNTDGIIRFLSEEEAFQSKGALTTLARALSISISPRNTKQALIHSIAKHFERTKMDDLISRGRSLDPESEV